MVGLGPGLRGPVRARPLAAPRRRELLARKVRAALEAICSAPGSGKALKEELAGLRGYRVGRFRVVYRVTDDRTVEVIALGPRRRIYEETHLLVRRSAG